MDELTQKIKKPIPIRQMRDYIFEFSQERAIFYELDIKDLLVLDWFLQFINSGNMHSFSELNEHGNIQWWYWVSYEKILNDLPILGIKRRSLNAMFEKFERKKLIKRRYIKKKMYLLPEFHVLFYPQFNGNPEKIARNAQ